MDVSHLCLLMSLFPLAGHAFRFTDGEGTEFDLGWLSAREIIEEATQFQPGIAALQDGFIPVGSDLIGTGDPFFVKSAEFRDYSLYQIYHDSIDHETGRLSPGAVHAILPSLDLIFQPVQ